MSDQQNLDPDEFRENLQIDIHQLDEAVQNQAELYHKVSSAYSEAIDERDQWKETLNAVAAKVELRVREEAAEAKEKITEGKIAALVTTSTEYQEALNEYQDASYIANQWRDLKNSFEQRSHALRDLVQLYIGNWFGERASMVTSADMKEKQEAAQKARGRRNK